MICKYCGRTISNDSTSCPYCGSSTSIYSEPLDEEVPISGSEYDDGMDDEPSAARKKGAVKMPSISMPKLSIPSFSMPKFNLAALFSFICAVFSLVCLMRISAINKNINDKTAQLSGGISKVYSEVSAMNDKLSTLDSTVANVQTQAYNQYASQAITISKDLTDLTGPVTAGKYNQMFIVNAKGNLSLSTSFDWQKYNDYTHDWVSIEFAGNATTNEEYGLRLENSYDKDTANYVSILWANGITPSAAGTYRCVITDINGLTNTSSEAVVSVAVE